MTTPEGEGGGGNRISEEQIKAYLDATLGEAPRPSWGVPQGWGAYLAGDCCLAHVQVASWLACTGRDIQNIWAVSHSELLTEGGQKAYAPAAGPLA